MPTILGDEVFLLDYCFQLPNILLIKKEFLSRFQDEVPM